MRRLATRPTVGAVVGAVVTAAGLTVTSPPAVMAAPDDRRPQARADRLRVLEDRVLRLHAPGVLANDSGSGRLRAVLAAAPARARVEVRPNGAVRVVPATDVNGLLRFAYRAVDAEGRSDRAVGRVRVVPVNDAPVFVPGPDQVVGPDAGRQVVPGWATGIDAGAPNEQAQRLAFRIDDVSDPALFADDGLPTVSPKGLLSYTPAPGANGSATVTVTLTDDGGVASGGADRSTATQLRITISPRSVPPAVTAGPGTTSYFAGSAPVPLAPGLELVDDDSDIAGATVALVGGGVDGVRLAGPSGDGITASYDAASGILTLSGRADAATYQRALRTVTFATGPGASRGPRPVTIEVEDADGLTGRATRDVQVVRDDPSTTTADVATAAEDTTASGNVLANDIDPDDTLTVTGHTQPARGTLTIDPDGDFTYTPEPDWNGTVPTVTYTTGTGATGTLDITITPVNDAPVAAGDSRILDEDGAATIDVLANDTDADGDPLSAVPVTGPVHGTVVVNANGTLTYTPDANFHGADSFTYRADDGDLTSGSATVTLTVEPVEDAPVAHDDSYRTPPDTAVAGDVLANDVDGDGDTLFAVLVTGAMHGTVTLHAAGSFTYTPLAGYRGTDSFTYAASDGHASGNTATVTVVVDDPTITVADTSTVAEDTQASGNVLANDVDPDDTLTVTSHTDPGTGTLAIAPDGSYTYDPPADWNGAVPTITYTTNTGATGTLDITITPVNDAPVATDDSYTIAEDTTLSMPFPLGALTVNDTDVDGDTLTVYMVASPVNGDLQVVGGNLVFTPTANYSGPASFVYGVHDGHGATAVGTVNITVTAVNDATVAVTDSVSVAEDTQASGNVLANDVDPDDTLTVTSHTDPGIGSLAIAPDGSYTYDPPADWNGAVPTITYTTRTGATGTLDITITPVNDAPVATDDSYTIAEGTTLSLPFPLGALTVNDTDVDGDTLTVYMVASPVNGDLQVVGGDLVFTPTANYSGPASFVYGVHDGHGATAVGTVNITVTPAP